MALWELGRSEHCPVDCFADARSEPRHLRLSTRKLSAALAVVDRRIAELFGSEPEPLEPLPAQSDAPALPTDREAALFKELEWRV